MPSSLKSIPQGVWTQVTTTDKSGEVLHFSGGSGVAYTESVSQPVGYDINTPVSRSTNLRDEFSYYNIAASDFLWAYAISGSVILTVTPGG